MYASDDVLLWLKLCPCAFEILLALGESCSAQYLKTSNGEVFFSTVSNQAHTFQSFVATLYLGKLSIFLLTLNLVYSASI